MFGATRSPRFVVGVSDWQDESVELKRVAMRGGPFAVK
jgi:hypothetical protein